MSHYQQVQQAPCDPEIIYILNSPSFKAWYQHHAQYFRFESDHEAAIVFVLEGLPDVVSQLTGGSHSCPSNTTASSSQSSGSTRNYPHYDGLVPILRSQAAPIERWEPLKSQLFGKVGTEEGKNHVGQSILTEWLEQMPDKKVWICTVPLEGSGGHLCGAGFSRMDRAVVHIRGKHLDMRPYLCGNRGNCQGANCAMAFTSRENRSEHWHPKKITCTQCGKIEMRQNVARHVQRCPGRTP